MVVMKSLLFLYNPASGTGKIRGQVADFAEALTNAGYDVLVHPTKAPREATSFIAAHPDDFSLIVAAGGDGLLHEAINGLSEIGYSVPLGYIPGGTVNDFANSHRIPFDFNEAVDLIISGHQEVVDTGSFNGEVFTYIAACGVSTEVSYTTAQSDKKRFGPLAYIVNGLNVVDFTHWENNCVTMSVQWDGGIAEGDFLFASISNTQYIGGSNSLTDSDTSFTDGLLEGLFIRRPMNLVELHQIAHGILRRDYSSGFFIRVQSSWFEIESEKTQWTLDGEFGGEHEKARIEANSGVLRLIRPPFHETAGQES